MPELPLIHAFKAHCTEHGLVRPGDSLILSLSGGIDSIVLSDLFLGLRDEWRLTLVAGHFNHRLRGRESDTDEQFVKSYCERNGIVCYLESAETAAVAAAEKRSTLDTARTLRYRFLDGLRRSLGCASIATAHHADDNLETLLFNLIRGTGVHGLTGIARKRRDISVIRPLLFAHREEIRSYAAARTLEWREDSSNAKTIYSRNFLRHEIIPRIKENVNPGVTETALKTAEVFRNLAEYLRERLDEIMPAVVLERTHRRLVLDREHFLAQPMFMQESILRECLSEFAGIESDFLTVKALINICAAEQGGGHPFPEGVVFLREQQRLVFRRFQNQESLCFPIEIGQEYSFRTFSFGLEPAPKAAFTADPGVEYIDADKLHTPLVLRTWQHGDRFVPLGMNAEKKVSDFYIDEKISIYEKGTIPLLESAGSIVWICGKRLDDRFKVTPATQHILKLHYNPNPDGE